MGGVTGTRPGRTDKFMAREERQGNGREELQGLGRGRGTVARQGGVTGARQERSDRGSVGEEGQGSGRVEMTGAQQGRRDKGAAEEVGVRRQQSGSPHPSRPSVDPDVHFCLRRLIPRPSPSLSLLFLHPLSLPPPYTAGWRCHVGHQLSETESNTRNVECKTDTRVGGSLPPVGMQGDMLVTSCLLWPLFLLCHIKVAGTMRVSPSLYAFVLDF